MARNTEENRGLLRSTLIDIAERSIAEGGLPAIKARALAQAAGCSVGAIYNVFDDLQDLVLAVNGRTFARLGQRVLAALDGNDAQPPTERLIIIAHGYLDFALDHPRLWRALFDLRMAPDTDVPQWYRDDMRNLFAIIEGPVQECFPDFSERDVALMTRALFSSVHGIVLLGLENRLAAVPREELSHTLRMLLQAATGTAPVERPGASKAG